MSNVLNTEWSLVKIYEGSIEIYSHEVTSDEQSEGLITIINSVCEVDKTYLIKFYNADGVLLKVISKTIPKEIAVRPIGKTITIDYSPLTANDIIIRLTAEGESTNVESYYDKVGKRVYHSLLLGEKYNLLVTDNLGITLYDSEEVVNNLPSAWITVEDDTSITWIVDGANELNVKVYQEDEFGATIKYDNDMVFDTQEVTIAKEAPGLLYKIVIDNKLNWDFEGTSKPEFIMPIDSGKYTVTLTSPFGYRLIEGALSKHRGWDFAGQDSDVEIQSIKGGIVKYIGVDEDYYGNRVAIEHVYNNVVFYSIYQHLKEIKVSMDQEVTQGQLIGIQGGTGGFKTYPVHLHFQTSLDATDSDSIRDTAFDPFTGRMMHDGNGSIYAEGLEGGIYNWDYQTGMPTGLWFKSKSYTMYEQGSDYFSPNTHTTIDYYSQTRVYSNENKNNGLDYTNLYDYAN